MDQRQTGSEYFPRIFESFAIVEARWGAADGWVDVTRNLKSKVWNGRLLIPDLHPILAEVEDPKPNHQKALVVVYQQQGEARLAIIPTKVSEGRSGKLLLPQPDAKEAVDVEVFRKTLIGTKWLIARDGVILSFEEGRYGIEGREERRGVWIAAGSNRIGAVDGEGSHHDFEFTPDFKTGNLTVEGKAYSKLTRLPPNGQIPVIAPAEETLKGPLFECVLGTYGEALRGKRHPFVTLRPPLRDLWTPEIEACLKGSLSYEQVDYIGTAMLVIPETGRYVIDIPDNGTELRLNGVLMAAGIAKLREGVYEVEIYTNHWGQPYLKHAFARILEMDRETKIPFVNTSDALERFLAQKIHGNAVTQVSEFSAPRVEPPSRN